MGEVKGMISGPRQFVLSGSNSWSVRALIKCKRVDIMPPCKLFDYLTFISSWHIAISCKVTPIDVHSFRPLV